MSIHHKRIGSIVVVVIIINAFSEEQFEPILSIMEWFYLLLRESTNFFSHIRCFSMGIEFSHKFVVDLLPLHQGTLRERYYPSLSSIFLDVRKTPYS